MLIGGGGFLNVLKDQATARHIQLEARWTERANADQRRARDAASAEDLARRLSPAEIDSALRPTNTRRVLAWLEAEAAAARMYGFSATAERLSPSDAEPLLPGLVPYRVTLTGQAPHDGMAVAFLSDALSRLPGRVTLTRLTMERLGPEAPSPRHVGWIATLMWITNAPSP